MVINSTPIKAYLNEMAMTQEEFAKKAGISRTTLYGILYRETAAISTVKKIAKAMEVGLADLTRKSIEI